MGRAARSAPPSRRAAWPASLRQRRETMLPGVLEQSTVRGSLLVSFIVVFWDLYPRSIKMSNGDRRNRHAARPNLDIRFRPYPVPPGGTPGLMVWCFGFT